MGDDHFLKIDNDEAIEVDLPKGTDPGRVLFHWVPVPPGLESHSWHKFDVEVLDYDRDTAVFWMAEGAGIEYWLERGLDIELEGFYVVEGATCEWSKSFEGETDEWWDIPLVRRATEEEIRTENLSNSTQVLS